MLRVEAPAAQASLKGEPFRRWTLPDGTPWADFYRRGDGYLLRFPGHADFTIDASGQSVRASAVPGTDEATLQHLFDNQVLPLALSRQRLLVLHASAVQVGSSAVAFLGSSGAGKSTLAASFAASGNPFLTDDALRVELRGTAVEAMPAHPSIRLWDDSRLAIAPGDAAVAPGPPHRPKTHILAEGVVAHCPEPRPLSRMYLLGEGAVVAIAPISPRDALIELVKSSFLLDIDESEMLRWHFDTLSDLAARWPCFRLDYPRRYAVLPEVRHAVVAHANGV